MHSSRMRTGRSSIVCRSLLPGGCVCSRGCLLWGVSALGGVCSWRGCGIPACTEADTPPCEQMTDRCKNITLATTSLRPVNFISDFTITFLPAPNHRRLVEELNLSMTKKYTYRNWFLLLTHISIDSDGS